MYVPEKLKLNKFSEVHLPSPGDYFRRYGMPNIDPNDGAYSGDTVIDLHAGKIESIRSAAATDTYYQHQEELSAAQAAAAAQAAEPNKGD